MSTREELNATGTRANAEAEKALSVVKTALTEGFDTATRAYTEGHINQGDAAGLRDAYDVALGRVADAMKAVRDVHKLGSRIAVKADSTLKPTGVYADLPPLNSGVRPLDGGR